MSTPLRPTSLLLQGSVGWLAMAAITVAVAAEMPAVELKGLLFGDLYDVPSHHNADSEGATGVVVRRGYLTLDTRFGSQWDGRLRFELNQSGELETYDFDLRVKDLYVARRLGEHEITLGLSPSLGFDVIESFWDYRYLGRTPMDLHGVSSRDTGIKITGPVGAAERLRYRAMAGAGLEFGNEEGDGRKWMGALTWQPGSQWLFDFYADREELSGPVDRQTLQAFAGYEAERYRWGAQYSHQDRETDPTLELASIFLVRELGDKTSFIGRFDRLLQPSPGGDNISYIQFDQGSPARSYVAAFEYRVSSILSVTPNIVFTRYDRSDDGVRPDDDAYLRVTFFLNLE